MRFTLHAEIDRGMIETCYDGNGEKIYAVAFHANLTEVERVYATIPAVTSGRREPERKELQYTVFSASWRGIKFETRKRDDHKFETIESSNELGDNDGRLGYGWHKDGGWK